MVEIFPSLPPPETCSNEEIRVINERSGMRIEYQLMSYLLFFQQCAWVYLYIIHNVNMQEPLPHIPYRRNRLCVNIIKNAYSNRAFH